MQPSNINLPDFWEGIYQRTGSPRWDLGQPAPAFVSLLTGDSPLPPGKLIVLGCGTGNDIVAFASRGFDVVGVDFAPSAIRGAEERLAQATLTAELLQRDIFDLSREYSSHFDYVVEHTCFCAIHPDRRPEYVRLVQTLLKPTGMFIAVFFALPLGGGPPFGTTESEIRSLFEPVFNISTLHVTPNSVERRRGKELFAMMTPK
jgi:methyl halide transferase